jgi:hypothetical protein
MLSRLIDIALDYFLGPLPAQPTLTPVAAAVDTAPSTKKPNLSIVTQFSPQSGLPQLLAANGTTSRIFEVLSTNMEDDYMARAQQTLLEGHIKAINYYGTDFIDPHSAAPLTLKPLGSSANDIAKKLQHSSLKRASTEPEAQRWKPRR